MDIERLENPYYIYHFHDYYLVFLEFLFLYANIILYICSLKFFFVFYFAIHLLKLGQFHDLYIDDNNFLFFSSLKIDY